MIKEALITTAQLLVVIGVIFSITIFLANLATSHVLWKKIVGTIGLVLYFFGITFLFVLAKMS